MSVLWSSGAYDRTSGIHLLAGLAAAAEKRVRVKKDGKKEKQSVKLKASD